VPAGPALANPPGIEGVATKQDLARFVKSVIQDDAGLLDPNVVNGLPGYLSQITAQIPKSLVDVKGDLLVGTADNTVARKAAGADGSVLSPKAANSDGLEWTNAIGPANRKLLVGDVVGFDGYPGIMNSGLAVDAQHYALIQDGSGTTYINAPTGQSIVFRINNAGGGGGNEFFKVDGSGATLMNRRVPIDYGLVTALPTANPTPQNADRCTFTDSLTVPTYAWHLTYDASQTAGNRWLCVGGSPIAAYSNTAVTTASTTYATPTGGQITLTLPLAGDYDIWGTATLDHGTAAAQIAWSYAVGALAASDDWCALSRSNTAIYETFATTPYRHTGRSASDSVAEKVKTNVGTLNIRSPRSLRAMPVRVG
jgi:hypothetical protein